MTMIVNDGVVGPKTLVRSLCVAFALILCAPSLSSQAQAGEAFGGRTFRKGLWRFVRTLESVKPQDVRHKLLEQEMTRCVDPTQAMKAIFSSASIGSCHSSRPEKVSNKYIFSNRCDYTGPVSTVITVQSDEAYTEANELTVGQLLRKDLVTAKRIGDCREDSAALSALSDLKIEH
jgi:hypothetical protein